MIKLLQPNKSVEELTDSLSIKLLIEKTNAECASDLDTIKLKTDGVLVYAMGKDRKHKLPLNVEATALVRAVKPDRQVHGNAIVFDQHDVDGK